MYEPRYTSLARRISDRAVVMIPHRRNLRGGTNNTASFTERANINARRAAKAALRGRKGK